MASNKVSKDGPESGDTIKDLSPQDTQAEDIKGGMTSTPQEPGLPGETLSKRQPPNTIVARPEVPGEPPVSRPVRPRP